MTVKTDTELKGLKTRRDQLQADANQALQAVKDAQAAYEERKAKLAAVEKQIREIQERDKKADIVISEHAYLRWFERAMGFDLAEVREAMLTGAVKSAIDAMGTCTVPTQGGFRLVVKNRTVVTVEN